jgi:hypothetical protein
MAITAIQECRLSVGDTDAALPLLTDEVYTFYLEKQNQSVARASMDAARAILMYMSQRSTDSSVDIFSFKDSKACSSYMEALKLFLRDPSLNPLYNNCGMYAGGISVSDIAANNSNTDNVNSTNVFNTVNQSTLFTGGF